MGKRVRSFLVMVGLASACGGDAPQTRATPASSSSKRALIYSPEAKSFAVYARNSVLIGNGARVRGPVGVFDATPAPDGTALSRNTRIDVGAHSDVGYSSGSNTYAYDAVLHWGSRLSQAYFVTTKFDAHYLGMVSAGNTLVMAPFPRPRPVTIGDESVIVGIGETRVLTATSSLRHLTVSSSATVHLSAGDYELLDVTLDDHATLIAEGAVSLRIRGRLEAGDDVDVRTSSLSAGYFRIEVLGPNGGLGASRDEPYAVHLGERARVRALVFAPHGTVFLGSASTSTGAVVARDVWLEQNSRLQFQDGLQPLGGATTLAHHDTYGATEDEVLAVGGDGVLANDLDPDGYAALTATLVHGTHNGTVALSADGSFTYTPNPDFDGVDIFAYTASDGAQTSATATVTIVVEGSNDVPTITSIAPAVAHVGQMFRYTPRIRDPDQGDSHVLMLIQAPSGATLSLDGASVTWSPTSGQVGSHTFELEVTDTSSASDRQIFTVEVTSAPSVDGFVLSAEESLALRGEVADGHVGVRKTGSGWFLMANGRAYVESGRVGRGWPANLYADTVRLEAYSMVGDVYTNSVVSDLGVRGDVAALPPMPAFPATTSASPGSTPLLVNGQHVLSSTVSVGDVTVADFSCLHLLPGVHHFQSVEVGYASCITVMGPTEIHIAGRISADEYVYIGPDIGANIGPDEFRIEVLGAGVTNPYATPVAAYFGGFTTVSATVIVPNGTLRFGHSTQGWGFFAARHIDALYYSHFYIGVQPPSNRAPVIVSNPPLTANTGNAYHYGVVAADADANDELTFSLLDGPSGMTIPVGTATVTWSSAAAGIHVVQVRVDDLAGAYDVQQYTLVVSTPNTLPVITSTPTLSAEVGLAYTYDAAATDADGDAVTFSLPLHPAGMSINGSTGVITWTPVEDDIGNAFVTLRAIDSRGGAATQNFTLVVTGDDRPPVFVRAPASRAVVGTAYASETRALDPDTGDTVSYTLVEGPRGLTLNGSTGAIRWTPLASQLGSNNVLIHARDHDGPDVLQTTAITVVASNSPPEFTSSPVTSVAEGQSYTYQATATDADEGDVLVFAFDGGPRGMSFNPTTAVVTWTPTADQVDTFSVVLRVTDSANEPTVQRFDVEVTAVNDPPSFTSTPPTQVNERATYSYAPQATDPDVGDTLTFELTEGPAGMTFAAGAIEWLTAADDIGVHPVVVTVRDEDDVAVTQSFQVTVRDLNDAPAFLSTPPTVTTQNQLYTYAASAVDPDDGDVLTYHLDVRPPGMTVGAATGVVTWTPTVNQAGVHSVVLRVQDSRGETDFQGYEIQVTAVNYPPVFSSAPVLTALEGVRYRYVLSATDPNPADALTFTLLEGPVGLSLVGNTLSWFPSGAQVMTHPVTVSVSDGLAPPVLQTFAITVSGGTICGLGTTGARCDALGWTYSLAPDSVPLGGVAVTELRPGNTTRFFATDDETGLALLGGAGPGAYRWTFVAAGHVPVTREATLTAASLDWISVPRLAPLTDLVAIVTATGAYANDVSGRVSLGVRAGGAPSESTLSAAILDAQSLPAFLPQGWSSARAVYVEMSEGMTQPIDARFELPMPLPSGAVTILAHYDEVDHQWMSLGTVVTSTAYYPVAEVELLEQGAYAILVADTGGLAPAIPDEDEPVLASAVTSTAALSAEGRVVPETQSISEGYDAAQVTGEGRLWLAPASTLPSGIVLPARLYETYVLADGRAAEVPSIDLSLVFQRYPAAPQAPEGALSALFPVRPRYLLSPTDLADAHQRIELRRTVELDAAPLDEAGGVVSHGTISLTIPEDALVEPTLVKVEEIDQLGVELAGAQLARAFSLGWSTSDIEDHARLTLSTTPVRPDSTFVLARRELGASRVGWQPVEVMASNGSGILSVVQPISASLTGIDRPGTYALFLVGVAPGLVRGIAHHDSSPLTDVTVSLEGEPWSATTSTAGVYRLLARPGSIEVNALRRSTGDVGRAAGTLASAMSILTLDVDVAAGPPYLVRSVPAGGAAMVPVMTAIDLTFSEPVDRATLGSAAFSITAGEESVAFIRSIHPDRRRVSLLPTYPLEYETTYTVTLSSDIADMDAETLTGVDDFTFTTMAAPRTTGQSARLTAYEPGAEGTPCALDGGETEDMDFDPTGLPAVPGFAAQDDGTITCVVGSAGVADPDTAVILVNEESGVTATVRSTENGSFKSFIRARTEDLLSAVFVNANGTRISVPLDRQRLADGSVALYASGGTVDAVNPLGGGPLQLTVEPNSLTARSVFRLRGMSETETATTVAVAPPLLGMILMGAVVDFQGPPLRESVDVRFPIDLDEVELPPGTSTNTAGFILVAQRSTIVDGEVVVFYETLDRMEYEDGALATHSFPMMGLLGAVNFSMDLDRTLVFAMAVAGHPTAVHGTVAACKYGSGCARFDSFRTVITDRGNPSFEMPGRMPAIGGIEVSDGTRRVLGRRLPGALITASADGNNGGPNALRGRLQPGQLASVADSTGRFSMSVPLTPTAGFVLVATHFEFDHVASAAANVTELGGLGRAVRANPLFEERNNADSLIGPRVSVSHSPARPRPWEPEEEEDEPAPNERAEVRVVAQDTSPPTNVELQVVSFSPLSGPPLASTAGMVTLTSSVTVGNTTRTHVYRVVSPRAGLLRLEARATVEDVTTRVAYPIYFTTAEPETPVSAPVPEPDDTTGPRVVATWPPAGAVGGATDVPIQVVFNEPVRLPVPIEDAVTLSFGTTVSDPAQMNVSLSPDGHTLSLSFADMQADTDYTLTLTGAISDLRNHPLDQDPSTPTTADAFTLRFRSRPQIRGELGGLRLGAGAVVHGIFAYVIDREPRPGAEPCLHIYDISQPERPRRIATEFFPGGAPRALAIIPDYSYIRPFDLNPSEGDPTVQIPCGNEFNDEVAYQHSYGPEVGGRSITGCVRRDRTLLAVLGGRVNPVFANGTAIRADGQYVRLLDVTDLLPSGTPSPLPVVMNAAVSYDPTAVNSKLKWSPPILGYMENSLEGTSVSFVNLQNFIFGHQLSATQYMTMPVAGFAGVDANGDGDYVDNGDEPPLPSRVTLWGYAGRTRIAGVHGSNQEIRDYALHGPSMFAGAALSSGRARLSDGTLSTTSTMPMAYRTLSSGTSYGAALPRATSSIDYGAPVRSLDAIAYIPGAAVQLSSGPPEVRDIVVMAGTVDVPPPVVVETRLYVIDVTNVALGPQSLGEINGLRMPPNFGFVKTIELEPGRAGIVRVYGHDDMLRLDLQRLATPNGDGIHDAIVGVVNEGGSGSQLAGGTNFGVNVRDDLGVTFGGPQISFVSFPSEQAVVSARTLPTRSIADRRRLLDSMVTNTELRPARVATDESAYPVDFNAPSANHHVLIRAPGSSGETISVLLEGLDVAGQPVEELCGDFAPTRAMADATKAELRLSGAGADRIEPLLARRLSDTPSSDLYNVYLSDPFVLSYQRTSSETLDTVRGSGDAARVVLTTQDGLRASVDAADLTNQHTLWPFASKVSADERRIILGSSARATTFSIHRILGPNPPPVMGIQSAPGSLGMLSMHNRAMELSAVDATLASPRMPLVFARSYRGQDSYEGPFGPGWDFNFNERVVRLDANVVDEMRIPLVIRENRGIDTVARSRDVLLHDGAGNVLRFAHWEGPQDVPPGFAEDELLSDVLGWTPRVADWFIPPDGVFDALVRFDTGQMARLTPNGTQYWYSAAGRLEKVYDRFERNRHELTYSSTGDLRRITDVATGRFLEIGYHRATCVQPACWPDLDDVAVEGGSSGRVASLRDHTDHIFARYRYNAAGQLEDVIGPEVAAVPGAPQGAFSGARTISYHWTACGIDSVRGLGDSGETLLGANGLGTNEVVSDARGAQGNVGLTGPSSNRARDMAGANAVATTTGDGTEHEYTFNAQGMPTRVVSRGSGAPDAPVDVGYEPNGIQVNRVTNPASSIVEFTYDSGNANIRSRGNIVEVRYRPGQGSPGVPQGRVESELRSYDPLFNLLSGNQRDRAEYTTTVALTDGGREVEQVSYSTFSESFNYNGDGWRTQHDDPMGRVTTFDWDSSNGNLLSVTEGDVVTTYTYACPAGERGLPCTVTRGEEATEELIYNTADQLVLRRRVSTDGTYREGYALDRNGRPVALQRSGEGTRRQQETRRYNQLGFMLEHTKRLETGNSNVDVRTQYEPDTLGRLRVERYHDGEARSYTYDHRGRVLSVNAGTSPGSGYEWSAHTYDAYGNIIEKSVGGDVVETARYNGHGRHVGLTLVGSNETEWTHNGNGHVLSTTVRDIQSSPRVLFERRIAGQVVGDGGGSDVQFHGGIDALGRPLRWTVDGQAYSATYHPIAGDREVHVVDPGQQRTVTRYDARGATWMKSIEGLQSVTTEYDTTGRPILVTHTEHGSPFSRGFQYNHLGHAVAMLDGAGGGATVWQAYEPRLDGILEATTVAPASGLGLRTQTPHTVAGEPMGRITAVNASLALEYDAQRRTSAVTAEPATGGQTFTYEQPSRLVAFAEDGEDPWNFSSFDGRNLPQTISMPGSGSEVAEYDLQGRKTQRTVSFSGLTVEQTFVFDGLSRVQRATEGDIVVENDHGRLGTAQSMELEVESETFTVERAQYTNGARRQLVYPSGTTVDEVRTPAGELISSLVDEDTLVSSVAYAQAFVPGTLVSGPLTRVDTFDARRRQTSRYYAVGGHRVVDLRYAYDPADREVARQSLHRGGRADFFQYDAASRLTRAEVDARPELTEATAAPWVASAGDVGGSWRAGRYARSFDYSTTVGDLVEATSTSQWSGELVPSVAIELGQADNVGHLTWVDGVQRTRDELGNTATMQMADGTATLVHDGLNRLREVERANGIIVRYGYRADGVRATREIVCPGTPPPGIPCEPREEVLVYSGLQLLEVTDTSVSPPEVRARYYYEGEGDIPFAADFRDEGSGEMLRHYLLTDRQGSVIGVLDEDGAWVERVSYDPWGDPTIEAADTMAPRVVAVRAISGTTLEMEFSEAVLTAPDEVSSGGTELITSLLPLEDVLTVREPGAGNRAVPGSWSYVETAAGASRGTVLRFVAGETLVAATTYAVEIESDSVLDSWSNAWSGTAPSFAWGTGTVYSGTPGSTASAVLATSSVGNEVLFQAHSYEFVLGLYHARARVLDPRTGTFLQRDPEGYVDSVNQYAAMANDPVNNRDPTGMQVPAPPRIRINVGPPLHELERLLLQAQLKTLAEAVPTHIRHAMEGPRIGPSGQRESIESLRSRVRVAEEAATASRQSTGPGRTPDLSSRSQRQEMDRWARESGLRRQPDEARQTNLTERAEAIRQELINEGVIHPARARRMPVGVTQGNVPNTPCIVTVGDARAHEAIRSGRIPLRPGEVLGPAPRFDAQGRLLPESHVEGLGAACAAATQGATGGQIGTVPRQCAQCAELMNGSGWVHQNPQQ